MSLPDVIPAPTPLPGRAAVRKGTDMYRVLAALHEMPGIAMTSTELADETGLSIKQCGAYMYTLRQLGLAHSSVLSVPPKKGRGDTLEHWVGERVL